MANRRYNHNHAASQYQATNHSDLPTRYASRQHSRSRTQQRLRSRSEINWCVKYTVFGFNVVFWIFGFVLVAIGAWSRLEKNNLYSQLSHFYLDPAWILVIIGGVIWCIGFSGCVGALRENTCFLAIYSSILGLLLLTEALLVVLAFFAKDFIESDLNNRLDQMIINYRDDPDLQALIDWVQQDFECCGINDPDDWEKNIYFNSSATKLNSIEAGGVPFSCCKDLVPNFANFACGHKTRVSQSASVPSSKLSYRSNIFIEGCLPKMQSWLNNNFLYVGSTIFVVAVIQFLGICFAQDLRSDIFAQRAKWSRRS